jgi:hypothetical protein
MVEVDEAEVAERTVKVVGRAAGLVEASATNNA